MKNHLGTSVTVGEDDSGGESANAPDMLNDRDQHQPARGASSKPRLALASVKVWRHTVVLRGELHPRSATDLEAEIERLCEEGVTSITLDLRRVTYLDPIVVAVIAFRSGLCERRGYDFALIRGSRAIQRAFEQAGVAESLPFCEDEVPAAKSQISPREFEAEGPVAARRGAEHEPATDGDSHAVVS